MKIPFSAYDFFGYLIAGFVVLAAMDFAYNGSRVLMGTQPPLIITFWTVAAYVAGHLIAGLSSALIERLVTIRLLGRSEELLLRNQQKTLRATVFFRGYFRPLPAETVTRVLAKAKASSGISEPGRALFLHCWGVVKRDPSAMERLNSFLNLYGFSRNLALASSISGLLIGARIIALGLRGESVDPNLYLWFAATIAVAVGLFYRYLKFYRAYGQEVFISYVEAS